MLGIGPQEMLIIGIVVLIVFGSSKASGVARDVGRFVNGANRSVEELKREVLPEEEVKEVRRTVQEFKNEARHTVETLKSEVDGGERDSERSRQPRSDDGARERDAK